MKTKNNNIVHKPYDFGKDNMQQQMGHIDAYSIYGSVLSVFLYIFAMALKSEFVLTVSLVAACTTIIRNYTGKSLKILLVDFWRWLKIKILFFKSKK